MAEETQTAEGLQIYIGSENNLFGTFLLILLSNSANSLLYNFLYLFTFYS